MNDPSLISDPTITRSGEQWLSLSLVPHKRGLLVDVKAHPLVEEFMQSLSKSGKVPLETGRRDGALHWISPDDTQLYIYQQEKALMDDPRYGGGFTISSPASSFIYDEGIINLSFLRLAGISEGVKFISTQDVFPIQFRRELKGKIGAAFRRFCIDYIKPVKLVLIITGQEI